MQPKNLLFIMSDEHNPKFLGHAGHPLVKTPNLDRLVASGAYFTSAYSNGPICVPSRASFATGRYTFETGYWDNAHPYDGKVPGWGHRMQETGHKVVSIGKLHYRNGSDPTGFDEQIIPMHVVNGTGDVLGSVRDRVLWGRYAQRQRGVRWGRRRHLSRAMSTRLHLPPSYLRRWGGELGV